MVLKCIEYTIVYLVYSWNLFVEPINSYIRASCTYLIAKADLISCSCVAQRKGDSQVGEDR